ncbi:hypothetical protein PSEUDO9AG_50263 [Pseudomonas sp. 9Ag]|nr:hypothetical protein PSEUDO9AG_50263 [Pseudomonas sp. 9Ag]
MFDQTRQAKTWQMSEVLKNPR